MTYVKYKKFGDFVTEIYGAPSSTTQLLNVGIELTERCNFRCHHCYINRPLNDIEAEKNELDTRTWFRVLDQLAESGCLSVLFTGGEIFVRRDFLDIYTYAKRKGFLITLFTNGSLITESVAEFLEDLPPAAIEISVYAVTRKTYLSITKIHNAYDSVMRAIELLSKRKIVLELKSVVTNSNYHEIFEIKKFAQDRGMKFRFDAELNSRLDSDRKPREQRLAPRDVVSLDVMDEDRAVEFRRMINSLDDARPNGKALFQCGSAKMSYHIDAYGHLFGCLLNRRYSYDLRKGSVLEGCRVVTETVSSLERKGNSRCFDCDLFNLCGQCPALSHLETGDSEKPVQYLCEINRLRAEVFGSMTGLRGNDGKQE